MSEKLVPKTERSAKQEAPREMAPHEAVEIVFWSFYYSQGVPSLQKDVLEAVARQNEHLKLPPLNKLQFGQIAIPTFKKFFANKLHSPKDDEALLQEIEDTYGDLEQHFGPSRERSESSDRGLLTAIVTGMIKKDERFTGEQRLAERTKHEVWIAGNEQEFGQISDAKGPFRIHMSQFVEYIVRAKRAPGPAVFEKLMQAIRAEAKSPGFLPESSKNDVRLILADHNTHHPDEQVDIDECLKKYGLVA